MVRISTHVRRGFTALELLVCITVIGLLLAIVLPAVHSAREAARLTQCRKNLKELALASHAFHDTYAVFPGVGYRFLELLPHVEQQNLYDELSQYSGTIPSGSGNLSLSQLPDGLGNVTTYICPSGHDDAARYETSYAANAGTFPNSFKYDEKGFIANGMATRHYNWTSDGVRMRDVYDGASNTVFFAERKPELAGETLYNAVLHVPLTPLEMAEAINTSAETSVRENSWWPTWRILNRDYYIQVIVPNGRDGTVEADGQSYSLSPARGYHSGVTATAMVDGSVRLFSDSTDTKVWQDAGSRDSR